MAITLRYCSVQDVRDAYQMITADVYSNSAISIAISLVQAEIDGRIGQRYKVPFTDSVPELIRAIAIELTMANIIDPMHGGDSLSREAPLSERKRKRATEILDGIATGRIALNGSGVIARLKVSVTKNASTVNQTNIYDANGLPRDSSVAEGTSPLDNFDLYRVPGELPQPYEFMRWM